MRPPYLWSLQLHNGIPVVHRPLTVKEAFIRPPAAAAASALARAALEGSRGVELQHSVQVFSAAAAAIRAAYYHSISLQIPLEPNPAQQRPTIVAFSRNRQHRIHPLHPSRLAPMASPSAGTGRHQPLAATSSQHASSSPCAHGGCIRDYELRECIGRGTYAQCYRARCVHCGAWLCVKRLDKSDIQRRKHVTYVRREIETHARLRHGCVVQMMRFFEDALCIYIVMELCEGGSLSGFLQRQPSGVMDENSVRCVMRRLIAGISYLHSHGVAHRDIKPSNVLLDHDGLAKLSDFGFAQQILEAAGGATAHGEDGDGDGSGGAGRVCGTANYIAPELLLNAGGGGGGAAAAADVWSLGCLMYALLFGHPPFQGRDTQQTFRRVARGMYSLPWAVSSHASDVLHQLLQPLPQNRISLLALRSHPFFSDTAPCSPLPSCSFPSSTFTSSSSSSATTTPISRVVSLANPSSYYDMNACGSQDISIATSAHGSASTPSTAPRVVMSSRAVKEEEGAGEEKATLWLQQHLQAPAVTPPLDSSLRVVPSTFPATPLLSITCAFGCISLYPGLHATLHAPPPSTLGCISWSPHSAELPHWQQQGRLHRQHGDQVLHSAVVANSSSLGGCFSQSVYPPPPFPSPPSPLGHDALSRAAARTLLHFVALARSAVPTVSYFGCTGSAVLSEAAFSCSLSNGVVMRTPFHPQSSYSSLSWNVTSPDGSVITFCTGTCGSVPAAHARNEAHAVRALQCCLNAREALGAAPERPVVVTDAGM